MAAGDSPNIVLPPWGKTQNGGDLLAHPTQHVVIQHPNFEKLPRPAAAPFPGSSAFANWLKSRPKNQPSFSAPRGLSRGYRK